MFKAIGIIAPDGHEIIYVVDVRLNDLTPHYVYATSRRAAKGVASGATDGVWEYVATANGHELAPVPADRYVTPRGKVLVHTLMIAPSAHARIAESQACMRNGCGFTETVTAQ